MKALIIGGSGLVGSNCMNHFLSLGWEVVGTHLSYPTKNTVYFNSGNLEHPDNFNVIDFNPDVIVHTGALTWVDYCENNVEESYERTVISAQNIIKLCLETNAKLVYYSTDYVFDGAHGPYDEKATPNPINVYGEHKLLSEQTIQEELGESFLILRITNVYGNEERGKNFIARFLTQIENNESIDLTLPFDQYATPVNASDIAVITGLLVSDNKSGIYHIGGYEYLNRYQLANLVVSTLGYTQYQFKSVSTVTLSPPANRPLNGGLLSRKLIYEYPDFQFSTVQDYLLQHKKSSN